MNYPFPTQSAYKAAQLREQFGIVEDELDLDPALHYKLTIPLNWGQIKSNRQPITPQAPMQVRGIFRSLQPPFAEVKVVIVYLKEELSPSDWLSIYLEQTGEQVVNERHTKQEGGSIPDVLSVAGRPGEERISRWLVLKDWAKVGGAHLFVVQVRTDVDQYNTEMANRFFVIASQFDLLHSTNWAYAEQLRTLVRPKPIPFNTAYPQSWRLLENPAGNDVLYQVQLTKVLNGTLAGRITLALVAQKAEPNMKHVPDLFINEYSKQGIQFDPLNFKPIAPFGGMQRVWYARSRQVTDDLNHPAKRVIEIVIGQAGENWVYGEQHSPSRDVSPEAWAISKRAFEIILDRLTIL